MEELIKKVEAWSKERGLNVADPNKQRLKLWEEFGELNAAIARDNRDDAIDAIGDMLVVMIIYKQQLGCTENDVLIPDHSFLSYHGHLDLTEVSEYIAIHITKTKKYIYFIKDLVSELNVVANKVNITLEECLQSAYDVIKDRKGKMINGVFVKEADLK